MCSFNFVSILSKLNTIEKTKKLYDNINYMTCTKQNKISFIIVLQLYVRHEELILKKKTKPFKIQIKSLLNVE